jgi:protein kinase-like protein
MPSSAAVSPHATLAKGTVLSDRFEIESVLGEGAMGVVYRAADRAAGRPAAVKVLHKHLAQSREYISRFRREANAASRFRHDNAVRVLGAGETEDRLPYIAMELVQGRSLKEIIAADGPLAAGRASNLVAQLLRALGAAHRAGIVHRDMKPENIRVELDDDGIERPKILDFGVAKFISGDMEVTGGLKTKTGVILGTPKYMAPEQIRGEAIDGRADVYAVGAMLHEMLCGKPPFEAEDVFGFVAMHLKERVLPLTERFPDLDVPEALDDLVLRMLEKNPQDRPADATALADEVARFAVEDPRAAEKGRAMNRGVVAVVGAGLLGAVLGFVLTSGSDQGVAIGPCVAAAALGLAAGAAVAARLFPRPSVYGFVKRLGIVGGALFVLCAISVPMLNVPWVMGAFLAAGFGLAALLAYAAYLIVWSSRAVWLRPLVAGIAAPLVATLLVPVLVVSPEGESYFVGFLGSASEQVERAARAQNFVGMMCIALTFGLASLLLPRPGAARR